jgi:hypothetical protein
VAEPVKPPTAAQSLGAMWLYTLLRFGVFFVLFGLLWLFGLGGFVAALIALVLSIPLSYVLLVGPRQRLAANLEQRINARRSKEADLDQKLSGEDDTLT